MLWAASNKNFGENTDQIKMWYRSRVTTEQKQVKRMLWIPPQMIAIGKTLNSAFTC